MNGYTYILNEREVSFNEFVWRCARNFNALIHMRDDGLDAKITLPNDIYGTYSSKQIAQLKEDLNKFTIMSLKDAQKVVDKEYELSQTQAKESIEKKKVLETKVRNLLSQVRDWQPPTKDHDNLKKFMVDSLLDVIKYDCDPKYYNDILMTPKPTPEEWLEDQIRETKRSLEYHTKSIEEDKTRSESVTKWITDLQKSVPLP